MWGGLLQGLALATTWLADLTLTLTLNLTLICWPPLSRFVAAQVAGDARKWLLPSLTIAVGPTQAEVQEAMPMRQSTFVRLDRKHEARSGDRIWLVRHYVDPSFVHSGLRVARDTGAESLITVDGDAQLLLEEGDTVQVARLPTRLPSRGQQWAGGPGA